MFGALLTQRQFTAANFDLRSLNRPDALNNFQTQLTAEQLVYDFGGRKNGVISAEIGKKMTEEDRRRAELQLIANVARTYHGVTLSRQALQVAEEAVKSAEADLKRAESVQAAASRPRPTCFPCASILRPCGSSKSRAPRSWKWRRRH